MTPTTPRRLAVLRYRRIGPLGEDDWLTSSTIEETRFDEHLKTLRRLRWTPISGETFVAGLADPRDFPERAVLVTVDGGYRSFVEHALPILDRYRAPAVVFVATDRMDATVSFEPELDVPVPTLGWEELSHLAAAVEVGSMGTAFRRFSALGTADIEREVADSRSEIARRLGHSPALFAYPGGDAGNDPATTARVLRLAGYRAAFLAAGAPGPFPPPDPWRVPRLNVTPGGDLEAALELP
jgi:peptidoglycan/xylan/chitin deacetylase (PgdA/CDA1 family)